MQENLTIAEEKDEVFGPMLSWAQFQGGVQRHPSLSIPVRWLLLQFVQICAEKKTQSGERRQRPG